MSSSSSSSSSSSFAIFSSRQEEIPEGHVAITYRKEAETRQILVPEWQPEDLPSKWQAAACKMLQELAKSRLQAAGLQATEIAASLFTIDSLLAWANSSQVIDGRLTAERIQHHMTFFVASLEGLKNPKRLWEVLLGCSKRDGEGTEKECKRAAELLESWMQKQAEKEDATFHCAQRVKAKLLARVAALQEMEDAF